MENPGHYSVKITTDNFIPKGGPLQKGAFHLGWRSPALGMGLARTPSATSKNADRMISGFDLESAAICDMLVAFEIKSPVDVRSFPCWR
jgi:hypothetical protein